MKCNWHEMILICSIATGYENPRTIEVWRCLYCKHEETKVRYKNK